MRNLQHILLGLAVALSGADLVWAAFGHFEIDAGAYSRLGLVALALFGLGLYYDRRRDRKLGAMLLGTSFLCAFSAAASVLNYFLLRCAGPRIDLDLAGIDRAMGVDWVSLMSFMAAHPWFNGMLFIAYGLLLPQIALLIVILAWNRPAQEVYRFCLALAAGALIAIAVWTFAPSFGAFSVYALPASLKINLALDHDYAHALVALLQQGPGFITPRNMRGLIGFPSYHAVLALLVMWYGRKIAWARWPLILLNLLVLVATPIQGGHHVIDVLAAIPVTLLALAIVHVAERTKMPAIAGLVNRPPEIYDVGGLAGPVSYRSGTNRRVQDARD